MLQMLGYLHIKYNELPECLKTTWTMLKWWRLFESMNAQNIDQKSQKHWFFEIYLHLRIKDASELGKFTLRIPDYKRHTYTIMFLSTDLPLRHHKASPLQVHVETVLLFILRAAGIFLWCPEGSFQSKLVDWCRSWTSHRIWHRSVHGETRLTWNILLHLFLESRSVTSSLDGRTLNFFSWPFLSNLMIRYQS